MADKYAKIQDNGDFCMVLGTFWKLFGEGGGGDFGYGLLLLILWENPVGKTYLIIIL